MIVKTQIGNTITIIAIALIIVLNLGLNTAQSTGFSQNTAKQSVILILGDSLSSAYGINQSRGWVSLLEAKLLRAGFAYQVVNASISGETTQGGVQRLPKLLKKYNPAYVIIELGGNDGLRGLSLQQIKSNVQTIITRSRNANADIVLAGIRLPPNYGQFYTESFYRIYSDLAQQHDLTFIPHLLENVATNKALMQDDGIHPVAEAQKIIVENVWQILQPVLKK